MRPGRGGGGRGKRGGGKCKLKHSAGAMAVAGVRAGGKGGCGGGKKPDATDNDINRGIDNINDTGKTHPNAKGPKPYRNDRPPNLPKDKTYEKWDLNRPGSGGRDHHRIIRDSDGNFFYWNKTPHPGTIRPIL